MFPSTGFNAIQNISCLDAGTVVTSGYKERKHLGRALQTFKTLIQG